jgi:hypothetical protein
MQYYVNAEDDEDDEDEDDSEEKSPMQGDHTHPEKQKNSPKEKSGAKILSFEDFVAGLGED